jgi:hypothetical protein
MRAAAAGSSGGGGAGSATPAAAVELSAQELADISASVERELPPPPPPPAAVPASELDKDLDEPSVPRTRSGAPLLAAARSAAGVQAPDDDASRLRPRRGGTHLSLLPPHSLSTISLLC